MIPIIHKRSKEKNLTPEKLWEDEDYRDCRSVRVQTSKVMRYRPVFKQWEAEFTVLYSLELLNIEDVKKFCIDAGAFIGFLDFRPRFGRFDVISFDGKKVTKQEQMKLAA